jgi:DNA polymerase III subunit gamma/tau
MPTTALHLAYRPQALEDLVGQPYVKTTLTNAIASQQIAPAYLFTGPRGTGKTSTARVFAKSLNCLSYNQPTLTPCGECQSCRSIETSSSLDVSEIDAASHNGVEDARALIERVNFAPALGRYRIFILDEVHSLTSNAFNALLKCIEEPPKHVVFILCTTESHKVLPTITSRCQKFEFRALSTKTITVQLRRVADAEGIAICEEALLAIARLVDGGMRDALQLLTQVSLLNGEITATQVIELAGGMTEGELLTILQAIASSNVFNLLQSARELIDAGKSPKLILSNLLQIYRDLLIVKSAPQEKQLLTGAVCYPQLKQLAQQWSNETIHAALVQLQKNEAQLRQTTTANVWIEVCLLNLIPGLDVLPVTGEITHNGSKRKGAPPDLNLTEIWQQVRSTAPPSAQKLLDKATLTNLCESQAVVRVEPRYLSKFEANAIKISRMLQKAVGASQAIAVTFKER